MILIPRWLAVVYVILVLAAVLGLGLLGYNSFGANQPPSESKALAERMLFFSVLAAIALLLVVLFLFARTANISRELDKMVELNRYGDFSPEVSMKKLGSIGEKITLLYFRLNALSEKRALKISALSDLVQLLATNVSTPLLIGDVTGEILYVSRLAGEKLGKSRAELLNAVIPEVLPSVNLQTVINQLDRTRTPQSLDGDGNPISIVPVYNKTNELAYIIWAFTKDGLLTDRTEIPAPQSDTNGMSGLLRRVFAWGNQRRPKH